MNNVNSVMSYNASKLSSSEFDQLAKIVYANCGVNLTKAKAVMLESRLNKRLRVHHHNTFREYIEFLTSKVGMEEELIHMIDAVTTNKTDFFREPHHFDFLRTTVLPDFVRSHPAQGYKIWSAACSTGEEPYTLAMVLQDFAAQHSSFSYGITGSDISTQVLQRAALATYPMQRVEGLPLPLKQRYFLKSKDKEKPTVRIISELRNKVNFIRLNLMESAWNIPDDQDAIFCRNVLIYFDRDTQLEVVGKLARKLRPGGHFFIGHSESLHQFDLPFTQIRPTIFVKK